MSFKACRVKAGFTQQQVADELNTSRVTVSRWESGIYESDHETLRRLSVLYGCTVDDLLNPPLPSPPNEVPEKQPEGERAERKTA